MSDFQDRPGDSEIRLEDLLHKPSTIRTLQITLDAASGTIQTDLGGMSLLEAANLCYYLSERWQMMLHMNLIHTVGHHHEDDE